MPKKLLLILMLFGASNVFAQNLYIDSNAASPNNEANTTTGWSGSALLFSDNTDPQSGLFAIRAESNGNNGTFVQYSFNAVAGQDYTISIWAREGDQSNQPAFANWQGVSGFSTTNILGNTWTEYVFDITATSNNPVIRVYTSPWVARLQAGNAVLLDNISILPEGVGAEDTESPSAVTDVSSSNTTSTGTQLNWSASTDNVGVTNYEVFQNGVSIANTGTATTFTVTGLSASTSYDFTVFAEDAEGNVSAIGNTETVVTGDAADTEAPSAVTDVSSSNTTSTGTQLNWSASTDNVGVTNYEVFQNGVSIANTGTATTFTVTGLSASTSYDFTVFAEDAEGNVSAIGNTETVVTGDAADTEAPSAVTDVSSSNTTSTGTQLDWSASTDNVGVTNYEVFQNGVSIANTGTTTNFNVTGLTPSTMYNFMVTAADGAGNISGPGNTVSITTVAAPDTEAPSAVSDLAAAGTTSTSTTLSWSASTDNVGVINYEVFRDGTSIGNTGTSTTLTVNGLTPDTSYNFTVFAEDAAGNTSNSSNTAAIVTLVGTGITDYTSENANLNTVDWAARDLFADRNVGIGTTDTQGYRLAVAGNMIAEAVRVELQVNWPDFVFNKDYDLPQLEKIKAFIALNGHLPNIPSAKEVENSGIDLGSMDAKLLQKIEELTLYLIEQDSEIEKLKEENEKMQLLLKRMDRLESKLNSKSNNE
ncbi:fibronectin type III domain-containing protein [Flagellimonas sp. C4]|uniref:fibronectin type III domain-containing protein n=1 Tax=Flagellimonas alginolytica TaxID=3177515 RepID=UPI0035C92D85